MKEKKIGIVGLGVMGKHIGRELRVASGGLAKVIAVVEPDDEKFRQGCEFLGYEPLRCYTIGDILEHGPDGIVIASPNHCHLENLKALSGSKLPLLLEKPLDSSFDKICDLVRFAENYRGPIVVEHNMRYAPIVAKAKELIDSGLIGGICSVSFVQNCFYGNSMYHNFRRTMAGGGGMFIEKATHDFDIMMYLLESKPIKVSATARMQAYGGNKPDDLHCSNCEERLTCKESVNNIHYRAGATEMMEVKGSDDLCVYAKAVDVRDNEVCLVEFENGTFGTYTQCFFSPPSYTAREYEIVGLKGIMRISFSLPDSHHNKGRLLICPRFGTPEDVITYDFDYGSTIHYNADGPVATHFFQVMDGDQMPFTTVRQAFLAELLGYAATLAAQRGEFVFPEKVLPPDLRSLWCQL